MSAVLSAPSGAQANTDSPVARNLEQKFCSWMLRKSVAELATLWKTDTSGASRMRNGERGLTFTQWFASADDAGYKLVNKQMECMHRDEAAHLRAVYLFVMSDPAVAAKYAATKETVLLDWEK